MSSFNDKAMAFLSRHGRKLVIAGGGVAIGLLLTVTTIWLMDVLFAPPVPELSTASAHEVAAFLAHKRGFARLPIEERRRFLLDIYEHGGSEGLGDEFERMAPSDRSQVRNAVLDVGLDQLSREARVYNSLPPEKREEFVDEFMVRNDAMREQLSSLAEPFQDGLPKRQDQWTKLLVTRTSASDRAKLKPLVDHALNTYEQRHAEAKSKLRQTRTRS